METDVVGAERQDPRWTPPKVASRVTCLVTPCSVRSPVIVPVLGPVRATEVDLNVAVGKPAALNTPAPINSPTSSWLGTSMLVMSMVMFTELFSGAPEL